MDLDQVLTLAIGRNNADGELPERDWESFQAQAVEVLNKYSTLVAATSGAGIGSDDTRLNKPEDTAIFVAVNPTNTQKLRASVAQLLKSYKQSSAAFSLDVAHEPVFATADGYRA